MLNNINVTLVAFFKQYINALALKDLSMIKQCYQLPCTLSTPDKIVLLTTDEVVDKEFSEIFAMFVSEGISGFKTSNTSYQVINATALLVNVDWQFFDDENVLFTEFSAIYHIAVNEQNLHIFNVISQDISQSLSLDHNFTLQEERSANDN